MAQSAGVPAGQPGGSYRHPGNGEAVQISWRGGRMYHRTAREEQEAAYYIGSGSAGRSYLVRIADGLFQSPASWYAQLKRWAASPGFENDPHPEFTRPVTPECLFCHTGSVSYRPDSINRYSDPPFTGGITCERCHGQATEHVLRPSRANIVNPARLPPAERDSVCEACHLSGEARIVQPGKSLFEFQPGMKLEDVVQVFVTAEPDMKVVSHAEQLAVSPCARSGKLWCGTCHDAHSRPVEPAAWFRAKCLGCHNDAHFRERDCTACHMPKRAARDVAHTSWTDHRISRRSGSRAQTVPGLRAWRGVASRRNAGLAQIATGEKRNSTELLQQGFGNLVSLGTQLDNDPAALTAVGHVLLRKGRAHEAAQMFSRCAKLQPTDPRHYLNLAAALSSTPDKTGAIGSVKRALALDPMLAEARTLLDQLTGRQGR